MISPVLVPYSLVWGQVLRCKTGGLPVGYPSDLISLYTLRDDIHGALKALLASAQHSIVLNMYGYDDAELDGLIVKHAADPNIFVQMSLDKSQACGVAERKLLTDVLGQPRCNVAEGMSAKHAISHLKVLIVDGVYLVTGSTNWSLSGETKQDNEITIGCNAARAGEFRSILDTIHADMVAQHHTMSA